MKKTVFYYTSTYFLDISLEIINVLKEKYDLHVLIEITASSKNANIINVDRLPEDTCLVTPEALLNEKDKTYFTEFFEGTKSVNFVVHTHPTGFSLNTLKVTRQVKKYINQFKPSVIHFEGFTLRTLGLITLLFSVKKVVITVHDAVLHSGENTWKSTLPRFLFFNIPVKKTFLFYSAYSMNQFVTHTKHSRSDKLLMEMHPFSYFTKIADNKDAGNNYLLFFGRISKYKGVDILLNAMPDVIDKFPEEQLIIAGKGASDDLLQHPVLQQKKYNACIINRYIPNEELVGLIKQAKLVICPYIDATQSGVLMTAFALNKPVIASNVGAFQEHIKSGVNGFLVPASDSKALAQTIIECLGQNRYLQLEENIKNNNKNQPWKNNLDKLALAYGDKNM